MKRFFFITLIIPLVTIISLVLHASPEETALKNIQTIVSDIAPLLTHNRNYDKNIFDRIHTQCELIPGVCKAERLTPFGITLFVGTGVALGVGATLVIQNILHIIKDRS